MQRKIILILLTLTSFYFCLWFGYIWTAYGHGGPLLGIPFALVMMVITIIFIFSTSKKNQDQTFAIGIIFFLTLAAFGITVEIITQVMKDYFKFLYIEPGGYVNKIFLGWVIIGLSALFLALRKIKKA